MVWVSLVLTALAANGGRLAVAGSANNLPAEANIWYNLEQINGYDALGVRWFEELRQASQDRWPFWDNPIPLNLFNVKQLLVSAYNPDFQGIDATNTRQLRRASKQRALNIYLNQNYRPLTALFIKPWRKAKFS